MKKMIYCSAMIIFFMSLGLVFSNNIWFDESYTLELVKHNFTDIVSLLKMDMHPPLYFISLKFWMNCTGYSLVQAKIFSALGLLSTLVLGCTLIRKDFGEKVACLFILFVAATPMVYYFSVQPRCYSWCIFWVTFCFVMGIRVMNKNSLYNCILFAVGCLFAAYNHIYALIAVAGLAGFVNLYLLHKRQGVRNIIFTDFIILLGYAPWMPVLFSQTRSAASGFWLTSLEPLSVIVFSISVVIFFLILEKKKNRELSVICGVFSIMFVQVLGLGVSLIMRPLYIARYVVPLMGILALVLACCFEKQAAAKKVIVLIVSVIILQFIGSFRFEYSASISEFRTEFDKENGSNNIFLYSDSSFGAMSYYYPENSHICFYYEPWFEVWQNVQFVGIKDFIEEKNGFKKWYVVNRKSEIPDWMKEKWRMGLKYSFRNDFNDFDVYLLDSAAKKGTFYRSSQKLTIRRIVVAKEMVSVL